VPTVRGLESLSGRKFELACDSLESCLIAYRVVTGEYHYRSQERLAFRQGYLQPIEGRGRFAHAETSPRKWQCGGVVVLATGLLLCDYAAGFVGASQSSHQETKVALSQRQAIVELFALVSDTPSLVVQACRRQS
jgi:hypothetical protein